MTDALNKLDEMHPDRRSEAWLQSPLPRRFEVPPLTQPAWQLRDLRGRRGVDSRQQLCADLCDAYGAKHCLLVDQARTALWMLVSGMQLTREWIIASFGYRPLAAMLRRLGADIAFADIGFDYCLDPTSTVAAISANTSAILVTHLFGKVADVVALREIADRGGLFLVENAVHMPPGYQVQKKPIGSFGDATLLSFGLDKALGGLGGGALLTNRDDVWDAVKRMPRLEVSASTVVKRMIASAINRRVKPLVAQIRGSRSQSHDGVTAMSDFPIGAFDNFTPKQIHNSQAAVANGCVTRAHELSQRRERNAAHIVESLAEHAARLMLPSATPEQPNAYLYFPIAFRDIPRDQVARAYSEHGIETKWRYFPLHWQTEFRAQRRVELPNTEWVASRYLLLPNGAWIDDRHVEYIARTTATIIKAH